MYYVSGHRLNISKADLADLLPEELEEELRAAAEISMGSEVSDNDMDIIKDLCEQVSLSWLFYITGHSVSNHPKKRKFETVPPPQILMKIYTFDLYGQKRRFAK